MRCQVDTLTQNIIPCLGAGYLSLPHTLKALSNLVPEQGYDLGLGTDGEIRIDGIIDERGEYVHLTKYYALYTITLEHKVWKKVMCKKYSYNHIS